MLRFVGSTMSPRDDTIDIARTADEEREGCGGLADGF